VHAFTAGAQLVVSSYLGLTETIVVEGQEVSFTAGDHAVTTRRIASSLLIPPTAVSIAEPGSNRTRMTETTADRAR